MRESGRRVAPRPVGAGLGVGGGGVCAQGPRPEHIAVDGARIAAGNRAIQSFFSQLDADARKLAQGQGGVLRYVPAARVATLTTQMRKLAKNRSPY